MKNKEPCPHCMHVSYRHGGGGWQCSGMCELTAAQRAGSARNSELGREHERHPLYYFGACPNCGKTDYYTIHTDGEADFFKTSRGCGYCGNTAKVAEWIDAAISNGKD